MVQPECHNMESARQMKESVEEEIAEEEWEEKEKEKKKSSMCLNS